MHKYKSVALKSKGKNMIEIEVKVLEIDKPALEKKLKSMGAKKTFSGRIENRYYDFPNRALRNSDTVLRLRLQGKRGVLCVKQKLPSKKTKTMEEREVLVDFGKAKKLLESLGLVCIRNIVKQRDSWKLGKHHVDIDQFLGKYRRVPTFFEIESESEKALLSMAQKLGFFGSDLKPWTGKKVLEHYGFRD